MSAEAVMDPAGVAMLWTFGAIALVGFTWWVIWLWVTRTNRAQNRAARTVKQQVQLNPARYDRQWLTWQWELATHDPIREPHVWAKEPAYPGVDHPDLFAQPDYEPPYNAFWI